MVGENQKTGEYIDADIIEAIDPIGLNGPSATAVSLANRWCMLLRNVNKNNDIKDGLITSKLPARLLLSMI